VNRKPLEVGCDGSVTCEVPGHVSVVRHGARCRMSHVRLTVGQRRTLHERQLVLRDTAEHRES
jgi:hypothetical protein